MVPQANTVLGVYFGELLSKAEAVERRNAAGAGPLYFMDVGGGKVRTVEQTVVVSYVSVSWRARA